MVQLAHDVGFSLVKNTIFMFMKGPEYLVFISVINQLDAQNFCFKIIFFHASTCFEHHVLIIRRSKLHYTASGIITLSKKSRVYLVIKIVI